MIDSHIRNLKGIGISGLDAYYMLATHDAQAMLLNWFGPNYNLTEVETGRVTALTLDGPEMARIATSIRVSILVA